jgi:hypothetical protein
MSKAENNGKRLDQQGGSRAVTLYQDKYRIESARLSDWDYRSRGWYFVTSVPRTVHSFSATLRMVN